MKITMLGTGNALVTECYNTCFVLEDEGKYFMIDGGGGNEVLKQLKRAGLNWMDMRGRLRCCGKRDTIELSHKRKI